MCTYYGKKESVGILRIGNKKKQHERKTYRKLLTVQYSKKKKMQRI